MEPKPKMVALYSAKSAKLYGSNLCRLADDTVTEYTAMYEEDPTGVYADYG